MCLAEARHIFVWAQSERDGTNTNVMRHKIRAGPAGKRPKSVCHPLKMCIKTKTIKKYKRPRRRDIPCAGAFFAAVEGGYRIRKSCRGVSRTAPPIPCVLCWKKLSVCATILTSNSKNSPTSTGGGMNCTTISNVHRAVVRPPLLLCPFIQNRGPSPAHNRAVFCFPFCPNWQNITKRQNVEIKTK